MGDYTVLYLIAAGLAGSALKAWVSMDQATISKKSIGDIVLGGAVGGLFPLMVGSLPTTISDLFTKATVLQQALLLGVMAYIMSDFVTSLLARFGIGNETVLSPHPISGNEVAARKAP